MIVKWSFAVARVALSLLIVSILTIGAGATSLWDDAFSRPYADHRASQVGDIVTVIIRESASGSQSSSQDASSGKSLELTLQTFLSQLAMIFGTNVPDIGNLTSGVETSSASAGNTGQRGELVGRITAVITDISPNGVMTLEGSKSIEVNGEVQTLTVTGKARIRDVSVSNTVESIHLADVLISFNGTAPVVEEEKPGLIRRFFGWLF